MACNALLFPNECHSAESLWFVFSFIRPSKCMKSMVYPLHHNKVIEIKLDRFLVLWNNNRGQQKMSYFIDLNHVKLPFLHAKVTVKYKPHMVQPKICKCYSLGDADKLWGLIRTKSSVQSGFPPGGPVCTVHVRWGSQVPWVTSRERGRRQGGRGDTERLPCLENAKKPSAGGG